jgi:16S rRNA (cytidine1402-2'-O)-methyltransferase
VSPEVGPGRLFVVSTPIGNMGDFSYRAVEVLKSVSRVLAEDTRHTRNLLRLYDIESPMSAYHEHNEAKMTPAVVRQMVDGADVALVSDAGTPLLSDPGARLVRAAIEAGVTVVPVPGASAVLAALVASGLDVERFTFYGFLARKGKERQEALAEIVALRHTSVLYEAPGRVAATLGDLEERGAGARSAVVAREMTKQFEEVRRGTVAALGAYYNDAPPRGEVVIVLGGCVERAPEEGVVRERARALRSAGMSARDVAAALEAELGVSRNMAYRLAQEAE